MLYLLTYIFFNTSTDSAEADYNQMSTKTEIHCGANVRTGELKQIIKSPIYIFLKLSFTLKTSKGYENDIMLKKSVQCSRSNVLRMIRKLSAPLVVFSINEKVH